MDCARPPPELVLEGGVKQQAAAWRKWRDLFKIFLKASGKLKTKKDVQASMMINLIGPRGYEIFTQFKLNKNEREDVNLIIKKFNAYFVTKQKTGDSANCKTKVNVQAKVKNSNSSGSGSGSSRGAGKGSTKGSSRGGSSRGAGRGGSKAGNGAPRLATKRGNKTSVRGRGNPGGSGVGRGSTDRQGTAAYNEYEGWSAGTSTGLGWGQQGSEWCTSCRAFHNVHYQCLAYKAEYDLKRMSFESTFF